MTKAEVRFPKSELLRRYLNNEPHPQPLLVFSEQEVAKAVEKAWEAGYRSGQRSTRKKRQSRQDSD